MNTQTLWQAQALDAPRISLAFVRQRSDVLRRWTRFRNGYNYVGGALLIPVIVWRVWAVHSVMPLYSLAMVVLLASGVLMTVRWHKRAASQERPAELGVLDALKFHRRQLERQRDVRLDIWRRWPAIPAIVMVLVAIGVEVTPTPWKALGLMVLMMAAILSFGTWMEVRTARGIQEEIDALDSL